MLSLPKLWAQVVFQSLSRVHFFVTPWTVCNPGSSVLHCLPEFAQNHVHWVSDAILPSILCHSLLPLPSIFPSIRVFFNDSALHIRWPKFWGFSNSPSNEYPGLISFRIDWFDLLAVLGALESLLQHDILTASVLRCLAFFTIQLSHLYMTTGKTIAISTIYRLYRSLSAKSRCLCFLIHCLGLS